MIAYPPFVFGKVANNVVKGAAFEQSYRPDGGLAVEEAPRGFAFCSPECRAVLGASSFPERPAVLEWQLRGPNDSFVSGNGPLATGEAGTARISPLALHGPAIARDCRCR